MSSKFNKKWRNFKPPAVCKKSKKRDVDFIICPTLIPPGFIWIVQTNFVGNDPQGPPSWSVNADLQAIQFDLGVFTATLIEFTTAPAGPCRILTDVTLLYDNLTCGFLFGMSQVCQLLTGPTFWRASYNTQEFYNGDLPFTFDSGAVTLTSTIGGGPDGTGHAVTPPEV